MLPLADGFGSSADEFATELGLFATIVLGVMAVRRIRRGDRPRVRLAGWLLLSASLATAAAAVTLPSRYLRPRIAKIRPVSTATLEILSPLPGQVVHRPVMEVDLRLSGGRIVRRATTRLRPDEGHVHVSIDGNLTSMTFGLRQRTDIKGLARGAHLLQAEFVAADHGPFNPRVRSVVTFRVE